MNAPASPSATTTISVRVPRRDFILGVNFPWIKCGWDFGIPPTRNGNGGNLRTNWSALERTLTAMRRDYGITVVRWWVMAGGANYPERDDIRTYGFQISTGFNNHDTQVRFPHGRYNQLPQLSDTYLRDFRGFVGACSRAGVKVLPSFMSFEWFQPFRWSSMSRGRTRMVLGEELDGAMIDAFLMTTLRYLVEATRPEDVYAWEIINEPDWVVAGGPYHPDTEGRIPVVHMRRLISQGARIITSQGHSVTVGFAHDTTDPWSLVMVNDLKAHGNSYVHQIHHYPAPFVYSGPLPTRDRSFPRAIIGEFASSNSTEGIANTSWSDAGLAEDDPHHYLERRLERIRAAGWDGGLFWSARAHDTRSAWHHVQQTQVEDFMFP